MQPTPSRSRELSEGTPLLLGPGHPANLQQSNRIRPQPSTAINTTPITRPPSAPHISNPMASTYPGISATQPYTASSGRSGASASSSSSINSQLLSDAEYARRLQEEEDPSFAYQAEEGRAGGYRYGDRRPPNEALLRGGGGVGGAGAPREQVRHAMLGELFTQARFAAISFWMIVVLNVPQLFFIVWYSIRYADKFNSCDKPLNLWLILYGIRLTMSTVVAGLPVCNPRHWSPVGDRYRRLNDMTNLLGFAVFIIGNFWIFDSMTCKENNPEIFKLSFALIVVNYILMLLPCALLVCLAPCVFCCLPLLIRVSGVLPPGFGLRLPGQQGASEQLINKLPAPKKFERGMFGGSVTAAPRGGESPSTNHDEPECAICLSNYAVGEEVRQLPCPGGHHFHKRCVSQQTLIQELNFHTVDDWLKVNATCPCCREPLLPIMADPSRASAGAAARSHPSTASSSTTTRSPAVQRPSQTGDESSVSETSALFSQSQTSTPTNSQPNSRRGSIDEMKETHIDMPAY